MDQTRKPVSERWTAFTEDALQRLPPNEAHKVRTKFRKLLRPVERADDPRKAMEEYYHTLHELVAGRFIQEQGYTPCYGPALDEQTPDWLFTGPYGRAYFFCDVASFHVAQAVGRDMEGAFKEGNT